MTKIYNSLLAGKEVVFSFGKVLFNAEGVAEIEHEAHAALALGVEGFHKVEEAIKEEVKAEVEKVEEKVAKKPKK